MVAKEKNEVSPGSDGQGSPAALPAVSLLTVPPEHASTAIGKPPQPAMLAEADVKSGSRCIYRYGPLDRARHEIRVIHLQPGAPGDPVRCEIEHVFLPDMPKYETISYVWGDKDIRDVITVKNAAMSMLRSCVAALKMVRLQYEVRTLWIDAVCIDQTSLIERNHQVALMRKIFSQGQWNLIYMGEADDVRSKHIEYNISEVLQDCQSEAGDLQGMRKLIVDAHGHLKYSAHSFRRDIDLEALMEFASLPWFTRLWVMQEAALCKGSLCYYGDLRIALADTVRAGAWLHHKRDFIPHTLFMTVLCQKPSILLDSVKVENGNYGHDTAVTTGRDVASTLVFGLNLAATEPKDHVFGLLGLMQCTRTSIPPSLSPDYAKSELAVFQDATAYAIRESRFSPIFRHVRHRFNEEVVDSSWSSWVPRYSRSLDPAKDALPFEYGFSADGNAKGSAIEAIDIDQGTIRVSGVQIGTVEGLCAVFGDTVFHDARSLYTLLIEVRNFVQHCTSVGQKSFDLDVVKRMVTTLCAGSSQDKEELSHSNIRKYEAYVRRIAQGRRPSHPEYWTTSTGAWNMDALAFAIPLWKTARNRRMLATGQGNLGLGPKLTQEGDLIVVLHGGPTPYVLRPWNSKYKLVGECYVYGAMHGEAMRQHEAFGEKTETFEIC